MLGRSGLNVRYALSARPVPNDQSVRSDPNAPRGQLAAPMAVLPAVGRRLLFRRLPSDQAWPAYRSLWSR